MITEYDIVADGTDNFRTRFLLNDACVKLELYAGFLSAAAVRRPDQRLQAARGRCLSRAIAASSPKEPPADLIPRCQTAGIFGAVAGVMGTLQATEIIKEILGLGETLAGPHDAQSTASPTTNRTIKVKRRQNCASCGRHP